MSRSRVLRDVAWRLLVAIGAGALVGAIVGGLGGRLAMFVLRLGSDPAVIGLTSDDGFEIGRFSSSTVFLLTVTAGFGGATGAVYLLLRETLPTRLRAASWGVLFALLGGAELLVPYSVDFTFLDPRPFAVAAFVVLPGLAAFVIAAIIERLLATEPWASGRVTAGLAAASVPLLPVLPVVALVGGVLVAFERLPEPVRATAGRLSRVAVPVVLAVLAARAGAEIWGDARAILR